jgi:hypothetical protein
MSPSGDDRLLSKDFFKDVFIVQDRLVAVLPAGSDYGIEVFDKSGKLDMKVADEATFIKAYANDLLLISSTNHTVKRVSGLFGSLSEKK